MHVVNDSGTGTLEHRHLAPQRIRTAAFAIQSLVY